MAQIIADQVRPLIVAWLLFTLPIVCHQQSVAPFVAFAGGSGSQPELGQPTSPHAGHMVLAERADSPTSSSDGSRHSKRAATEWCAHQADGGQSALQNGQSSSVLIGDLRVPPAADPHRATTLHALSIPRSLASSPLLPPPRVSI
jgi:hypothetical protein